MWNVPEHSILWGFRQLLIGSPNLGEPEPASGAWQSSRFVSAAEAVILLLNLERVRRQEKFVKKLSFRLRGLRLKKGIRFKSEVNRHNTEEEHSSRSFQRFGFEFRRFLVRFWLRRFMNLVALSSGDCNFNFIRACESLDVKFILN